MSVRQEHMIIRKCLGALEALHRRPCDETRAILADALDQWTTYISENSETHQLPRWSGLLLDLGECAGAQRLAGMDARKWRTRIDALVSPMERYACRFGVPELNPTHDRECN